MMSYSAYSFVALFLLIAAFYDFRFFIIPNWISVALIAGFVVFAGVFGFTIEQWLWHVGISVTIFLCCFALFAMKMMGGGDVKLMAATALWMGSEQVLPFVFFVSVFGALLAIVKMIATALRLWKAGEKVTRASVMKSEIPYGIAITLGALLVFPSSIWMA